MLHTVSHCEVPSEPQLLETQVSSEGVSIREAEIRQYWSPASRRLEVYHLDRMN